MKKVFIITSLSAVALLVIGFYMSKNDSAGLAQSTVLIGAQARVGPPIAEGVIATSASGQPVTPHASPTDLVKRSSVEQTGEQRSRNAFLAALRQNDLFGAFVEAANGSGIEGASTAAYISSVCLPYTKGRSKPFDLPEDHIHRLTANGEKNIAASRERFSEAMLERCKGFGGADKYMAALAAMRANLRQAGVENLFRQDESSVISEGNSLAINKVFQNPDSYLGLLMASTNDIFPRLGASLGGENVTALEARLAFEVGMCQLGVDCTRDSVGSINACIVTGVCSESTVQDKAAILAKAYGADIDRIAKMGDAFAAGVRRSDKSVLGYKP